MSQRAGIGQELSRSVMKQTGAKIDCDELGEFKLATLRLGATSCSKETNVS